MPILKFFFFLLSTATFLSSNSHKEELISLLLLSVISCKFILIIGMEITFNHTSLTCMEKFRWYVYISSKLLHKPNTHELHKKQIYSAIWEKQLKLQLITKPFYIYFSSNMLKGILKLLFDQEHNRQVKLCYLIEHKLNNCPLAKKSSELPITTYVRAYKCAINVKKTS